MLDMLPTERAVLLGYKFAIGQRLTVRQIADDLEVSVRNAYYMLEKASRVMPLTTEEGEGGMVWRLCGPAGEGDDEHG